MKTLFVFTHFLLSGIACFSQVYTTRSGNISFFSSTEKETVHAENNQVYAVIDTGKKNLAFALLIKSFQFDKELMQEHFNENYAESDKYPKASFNGSYSGDINTAKDGLYNIVIKGNLSFHNITREVETPANIEIKNNMLIGSAKFAVKPEEYGISIPSLVREKIAKAITIDVLINCSPSK